MRRRQSSFSTLMGKIELACYRYEVTFSPYVMTPGEKLVLNTIVVVLLSLLIIGIVTYLPKLLVRTAVKLVYFYAGANDKLSVNSTAAILHENELDEGVQEVSKPPARTTKESRHFGPLQHLRQQEARADVCQVFSKCIPLSPTH
jgi:hypothetical protein